MKNKSVIFLDFFNNISIIFSIFLLLISFYKSGLFIEDSVHPKYIKYIIFFAFLFIIFFSIRIIKNEFKYNILISLLTVVITIYFLEVLCTFIFKNRFSYSSHDEIKKEYYKKQNKSIPIYSKMEKRLQLQNLGELDNDTEVMHVIRSDDLNNEKIFPLSGLSKKNTIFCNEKDKFIFYESDRFGFNNNDKLWESEIQIILMGDSFGHGACVDSNNNISGNLNSANINTLNISYSGNGPLKTLGSLIEYGTEIKTQNYIWLYFEGNDLLELKKEYNDKILVNYLQKDYVQGLINKQKEINKIHKKIILRKINSGKRTEKNEKDLIQKIISFIKLYNLRISLNIDSPFAINNETIKIFEQTVVRSKEIIENLNSNLTFVYLPMYLRYDYTLLSKSNLKRKKEVIEIIKNHQINYIDLDEIYFSKLTDPLEAFPLKLNGHYTEDAYKDISKIILKNIKKKQNLN